MRRCVWEGRRSYLVTRDKNQLEVVFVGMAGLELGKPLHKLRSEAATRWTPMRRKIQAQSFACQCWCRNSVLAAPQIRNACRTSVEQSRDRPQRPSVQLDRNTNHRWEDATNIWKHNQIAAQLTRTWGWEGYSWTTKPWMCDEEVKHVLRVFWFFGRQRQPPFLMVPGYVRRWHSVSGSGHRPDMHFADSCQAIAINTLSFVLTNNKIV